MVAIISSEAHYGCKWLLPSPLMLSPRCWAAVFSPLSTPGTKKGRQHSGYHSASPYTSILPKMERAEGQRSVSKFYFVRSVLKIYFVRSVSKFNFVRSVSIYFVPKLKVVFWIRVGKWDEMDQCVRLSFSCRSLDLVCEERWLWGHPQDWSLPFSTLCWPTRTLSSL